MKNNILHIDTTSRVVTKIGIEIEGGFTWKEKSATHSQQVLVLIEELLKEKNLTLNSVSEIKVNVGPGSFTGIRVGIAVANTLGWILKIPVNGQKTASPAYSQSKFD